MKTIHLLRVTEPAVTFSELINAAKSAGLRVGWLRLESPPICDPELEDAAAAGVLRAVAVGAERSVVVKPLRGAVILRDLLREHFLGCRLVLVQGNLSAPLLTQRGESWKLTFPTGEPASEVWTTERLLSSLTKPRPWPGAGSPATT